MSAIETFATFSACVQVSATACDLPAEVTIVALKDGTGRWCIAAEMASGSGVPFAINLEAPADLWTSQGVAFAVVDIRDAAVEILKNRARS